MNVHAEIRRRIGFWNQAPWDGQELIVSSGVEGYGDIVVQRHWDKTIFPDGSGDWLTIEHADPKILLSHELLYELHEASADGVDILCATGPAHPLGDVLTIRARNRTVIYRVTGHTDDLNINCWLAEWPD